MEINWFIFSAQIVNFLILIAVLQRFLYRPIIRAMSRREQTIRSRLEAGEQAQKVAQQEAEAYRLQQQQLADKQTAMLSQTKAEVEQARKKLLENARVEVEATQSRWQTSIQQQKDSFLQELRHRAVQQIEEAIRRILFDLANVNLEQLVISEFLKRLTKLKEEEYQLLTHVVATSNHNLEPMGIHSAFEIPEESRQAIQSTLQKELSTDVKLQFETTPDLICGIELRASGCKLSWSFDNYLDALAENLSAVFEQESEGKNEPG